MFDSIIRAITARALIVEDHPETRRFFRVSLKEIGWEVVEAASAAEGRQRFVEFQPQVVTLDIRMAQVGSVSSLDFFRAIRRGAPQTAVFMVTGVLSHHERQKYLDEGARGFFLKPVLRMDAFETLFREIGAVRSQIVA